MDRAGAAVRDYTAEEIGCEMSENDYSLEACTVPGKR